MDTSLIGKSRQQQVQQEVYYIYIFIHHNRWQQSLHIYNTNKERKQTHINKLTETKLIICPLLITRTKIYNNAIYPSTK